MKLMQILKMEILKKIIVLIINLLSIIIQNQNLNLNDHIFIYNIHIFFNQNYLAIFIDMKISEIPKL
jgi:hypothetical protein